MNEVTKSEKKFFYKILALFLSILCIIYILNPTAGVIEILPDNIPFIGNLDEATATAILIKCIYYLRNGSKRNSP
jgi:uncharacterized membrane protein YkvA (DUF1232 family)